MKDKEETKDLICPVCCRYGKFDGKKCGRCGAKKKRNKFVWEKSE